MVPAKMQAVKKLLDAAGALSVQTHIDTGTEIVQWLRIHHGIDIAMVNPADALNQAHERLTEAYAHLKDAANVMDALKDRVPS